MFKKKKPPVESSKDRVNRHIRTADELVRRKKYDDALLEIESASKLDPKNMYIRSFLERIRYLIQKENEKQAAVFGEMDMIVERRMQSTSRLLATAEEFIKVKLYHRALAVIAKVYQIDPKNYYAHLYSDRIEELMRAEAAGQGSVDLKPPPPGEPEVYAPPETGPTAVIQDDAPIQIIPMQNEIPEPSALVQDDAFELATPIQDMVPEPYAIVQDDNPKPSKKDETQLPVQKGGQQEEAGRFALYRELLKECWSDGVITPEESAMLHRVRSQSMITFEDHCRLEVDIKIDAYVDALQIVWQDGVVTDNEQEVLEIMRKKFGITPEDQAAAEKKFALLRVNKEKKETILIVDPDQDDLMSIARALIGQGYDVRVARHPDDAFLVMKTNTPDLILSEAVFPQMDTDGFEFYQKVRSTEKWNQIPFLMMTYPGDAHIVRASLRMGVDYFLPKPLHIDFMVAIVEGKLKSGRQLTTSSK